MEPTRIRCVFAARPLETLMSTGQELWGAAPEHGRKGGVRSANAMRFYSLANMLPEAETAWMTGNDQQSVQRLRQLQTHCDKMIAELMPDAKVRPTSFSCTRGHTAAFRATSHAIWR